MVRLSWAREVWGKGVESSDREFHRKKKRQTKASIKKLCGYSKHSHKKRIQMNHIKATG